MIELSCFNDKGKKVSTLKPLKVTGHYQQLCKVVLEERERKSYQKKIERRLSHNAKLIYLGNNILAGQTSLEMFPIPK